MVDANSARGGSSARGASGNGELSPSGTFDDVRGEEGSDTNEGFDGDEDGCDLTGDNAGTGDEGNTYTGCDVEMDGLAAV